MTAVTFYVQVVRALDEIGAPYMIVGAFGGYPFGISRTTYDMTSSLTCVKKILKPCHADFLYRAITSTLK